MTDLYWHSQEDKKKHFTKLLDIVEFEKRGKKDKKRKEEKKVISFLMNNSKHVTKTQWSSHWNQPEDRSFLEKKWT